VARAHSPIAFTKLDRWLIGLGVAVVAAAALLVWLSQSVVAPPRPRISDSERPMLGLALRAEGGTLRVVRASGPAREAGIRSGDRVVAIDALRRPAFRDFADYVLGRSDGAVVKIEARRGDSGPSETTVLADVTVSVRTISPADEGLPYEDVSFRNADGLTLRGWYIPPPADGTGRAPAIAWGHGNGTDRRQWLPVALAVHEAGLAQVLFDFTGRGESDGDVITLGLHEAHDLRAALDFLTGRPEIDPMRLAVGGRSMGAAAALFEAAEDARVKALVLDSPFADLTALVDGTLTKLHVPAFLVRGPLLAVAGWRANYSPSAVRPIDAIRKVRVPILLLHGDRDSLVPFDDALALKKAAGGAVTFVPLPGIDHNTPRPDGTDTSIAAFLTKSLAR
jgi:uncharacterized protein